MEKIAYRLNFYFFVSFIATYCSLVSEITAAETVHFSEAEKSWLIAHPDIRVAPDPDFPPIEWFDANGKFIGIAADYLSLVQKRLGIQFRIMRCKNWDEVLEKAAHKEVDFLSAAAQTPQRAEYLLFSSPHIVLPGVIITRKEMTGELNLQKIRDLKVSIVSGYVWQEFISRDFPEIVLDHVSDARAGLKHVSFGQSDVFIENLATATYTIEKLGITNLRVAGETGYFMRLSFATRDDWPELNSILEKGLLSISPEEKKAIYRKWIRLDQGGIFRHRGFRLALAICAGVAATAILIFFAWNHSLRRQVAVRTAQIKNELAERNKVELALRESEEKFILMVENANSIILRMNPSGNVTYFNKFAEDFFGYSRGEIVGRNVVGTIVPDRDSVGVDLKATMHDIGLHPERYASNENENIRKNGERVWVSWSNKPIFDASGNFIDLLCVGNDITPLKRTQEALKSERDFNAAIFDTAGALVVVFDTNAVIVRFNRTCEQVTGYVFDEVKGRPFWDLLLVPEETGRIQGVFSNLVSGLFPNQAENFWKCKDGRLRLISWYNTAILDRNGAVTYIISTGIDITEHREAEKELAQHHLHTEVLVEQRTAELKNTVALLEAQMAERKAAETKVAESERRYRFLFEESPTGNIIIGLDGVIRDINASFQKTLGYSKNELIGKLAIDFITPEQRKRTRNILVRRMRGKEVGERDNSLLAKDGSIRYIIFSGRQTHLYENDTLIGILLSGVDVTDRRKAEILAARQQQELIHADKLASLGILVAGVAHEINNPNNFIILNSDNLRDIWRDAMPVLDAYSAEHRSFSVAGLHYGEVRDEVVQLITGISDGARRIRTIVQSLKDFARQGPVDMNRLVSLNAVIEQSTIIVANLIKKSTDRFTVEYASGLPEIRGDFQRIEQVMINLITNACQALTGRSQAVVLRTYLDSERHRIVAEVRDEGMGIPPENLRHIMDPFFTTKRDSGGTGLGLAISYGIVNDHHGQLIIESGAGKGTTVTVAFPEATDSEQGA